MNSNGEAMDSPSPSFNSYFNTNLAEVVATEVDDGDFFSSNTQNDEIRNEDSEDEDEFEFNFLVPADDGEIRPVYPVFDPDLLRDFDLVSGTQQIQLNNLFLEDGDGNPPSSSSSSSEDELEEIPHGAYCVWTPSKSPLALPERCRKSNSNGSSEKVKAWKLRDLLKRSKSDGKDQSVCSVATASAAGRAVRKTAARQGRSKEAAEKNKRRSYLPYRQDLVGFSVSPPALRKFHLLPFR